MTQGPPKSIAVLYNPLSGRGQGAAAAEALSIRLESVRVGGNESEYGVRVSALPKPGVVSAMQEINTLLQGAQLCIVLGGDGTVRATLPSLASLGIPMLTLGMGTENLFAKQFNMPRGFGESSLAQIEQILREGNIVEIDLAQVHVNQHVADEQGTLNVESHEACFSLMASMGPDASIVQRLSVTRNGPIRHWSYVRPIMKEVLAGYLPRCTVDVIMDDGIKRRLIDGQQGFVIIANSERYALGMNPIPHADMSDGFLEVGFFPASGIMQAAWWYAKFMLDRHHKARSAGEGAGRGQGEDSQLGGGCVRGRGRKIHVRLVHADLGKRMRQGDQLATMWGRHTPRGHALQVDGDAVHLASCSEECEAVFSICQARVKVIQFKR